MKEKEMINIMKRTKQNTQKSRRENERFKYRKKNEKEDYRILKR